VLIRGFEDEAGKLEETRVCIFSTPSPRVLPDKKCIEPQRRNERKVTAKEFSVFALRLCY